jgi:hypothetical protein
VYLRDHQEEAYVIIARNISQKLEVPSEEKVKIHAFQRKYREKRFRDEIRIVCEKHNMDQNVNFLESVSEYKKARFRDRVTLKQHIFNKYVVQGAVHGLPSDVVTEETIKIGKAIGEIDVFKTIEEHVFKKLASMELLQEISVEQVLKTTTSE